MFGCLPSQLYEEDADVFRLMNIIKMGSPEEGLEGGAEF